MAFEALRSSHRHAELEAIIARNPNDARIWLAWVDEVLAKERGEQQQLLSKKQKERESSPRLWTHGFFDDKMASSLSQSKDGSKSTPALHGPNYRKIVEDAFWIREQIEPILKQQDAEQPRAGKSKARQIKTCNDDTATNIMKLTAQILQGREQPSDMVESIPQKDQSDARMENSHEVNKNAINDTALQPNRQPDAKVENSDEVQDDSILDLLTDFLGCGRRVPHSDQDQNPSPLVANEK